MIELIIYNIRYDFGFSDLQEFRRTNVGQLAFPPSGFQFLAEEGSADYLEDQMSEFITERTGFLHRGFDYHFVAKSEEDSLGDDEPLRQRPTPEERMEETTHDERSRSRAGMIP